MNKYLTISVSTMLLFAGLFLITGCSSSDDAPAVPLETPIGDISGDWDVVETVTSAQDCNGTEVYVITITQTVNSLSVTGTAGGLVTGTVSDDALKLTGSRPFDIGTITYSSITGTVNATCSMMNLKTTWSYAEPGDSCNGTGTMEVIRLGGGSC